MVTGTKLVRALSISNTGGNAVGIALVTLLRDVSSIRTHLVL